MPCTVILAKKGRVMIPLVMRRVTPGFAPQIVDVHGFPDDPTMGEVRVFLRNPDGADLPFTDGLFRLKLTKKEKSGKPGKKTRGWADYEWDLTKRPHYIQQGEYFIDFVQSPWGRMLHSYLAEDSKTLNVKKGERTDCVLRMKKKLVPLRFRFFGQEGVELAYGNLNVTPAAPENLSRLHGWGKFKTVSPGFIGFGFPANPLWWRIDDIICYAPEGEEVLVEFKPFPIYGLSRFEERMVFFWKPEVQVVERNLCGTK